MAASRGRLYDSCALRAHAQRSEAKSLQACFNEEGVAATHAVLHIRSSARIRAGNFARLASGGNRRPRGYLPASARRSEIASRAEKCRKEASPIARRRRIYSRHIFVVSRRSPISQAYRDIACNRENRPFRRNAATSYRSAYRRGISTVPVTG